MAIDHRILQQIGVRDNANALNIFQNALVAGQNIKTQKAQEARRAELQPFKVQQAQQQQQLAEQQSELAKRKRILQSVNDFAVGNASLIRDAQATGDPTRLRSALVKRKQQLLQQDLPTETTDEGIALIDAGKMGQVISGFNDAVNLFNQGQGLGQTSVKQREFQNLIDIAQNPNSTQLEKDSARRELGDLAKASSSAQERIAEDPGLASDVAKSQAEIARAKAEAAEGEKLKQQLKHAPSIKKAVKLAEAEAKERGEVVTDVARMEASLPGVKEVVNELVELSSIATSTFAGRLFDAAVKESGFGSTKGADAKAKLIAIVDNQVLPLLKETFGAAFTVQEGDNLKASLVDPNASPSQKRAQLEAFINQKERNLRTKQAQLDSGQQQAEVAPTIIRFDAQGNKI